MTCCRVPLTIFRYPPILRCFCQCRRSFIEQSLFLFSPLGKWNGKEKIYILKVPSSSCHTLPLPLPPPPETQSDKLNFCLLSLFCGKWERTNVSTNFPQPAAVTGDDFFFFSPPPPPTIFPSIFFFGRRGEINGETRCGALLSSSSSSREWWRKASNFRSTPPPPISFSSSFAKWKRLLYLEGMPTAFRKGGGGGGGK